jgi:5-methylcytosine-specific restriction endonuclease McrA
MPCPHSEPSVGRSGLCRACYNEYHARYQRELHARRRDQVIKALGGCCQRCGSVLRLEIDHIDARTKRFDVSVLFRRSVLLAAELAKCQLLCHDCHRIKTVECGEAGGGWNKNMSGEIPHGTSSGYTYWKCRCDDCRIARRAYKARWRASVAERTKGTPPLKG